MESITGFRLEPIRFKDSHPTVLVTRTPDAGVQAIHNGQGSEPHGRRQKLDIYFQQARSLRRTPKRTALLNREDPLTKVCVSRYATIRWSSLA